MKIFKSILLMLVLALLVFTLSMRIESPAIKGDEAVPASSPAPTPEETPLPEKSPEPAATPAPTPSPTPTPEPEYFTISVIGDCTLTSHQNLSPENPASYAGTMKGDYSYPFSNTVEYFEADDFTISNLECTLTDEPLFSPQQFFFRTPTEYVNILLEGSVEFVTTANNHTMDFGEAGRDSTYAALEKYGMPYGKEGEAQIYETESGLKIGIYCDHNNYIPDTDKCCEAIKSLQEQGAEYIICAFHWGQELKYRPNDNQINLAHACIDAGADLIYGSHTHCLQPFEEYNDGLILYSMGNWSFGGSTTPKDPDTAIVQVKVKRDTDGTVSRDDFIVIPCCISSNLEAAAVNQFAYNDYCPTPYEWGTPQYDRAYSKINGSYEGPDGTADYSEWYESWG